MPLSVAWPVSLDGRLTAASQLHELGAPSGMYIVSGRSLAVKLTLCNLQTLICRHCLSNVTAVSLLLVYEVWLHLGIVMYL